MRSFTIKIIFIILWNTISHSVGYATSISKRNIDPDSIKNILIVFKTHLDIGFTTSKDSVIKTYINEFIPQTLSITKQTDYLWTTGSWLIQEFLNSSSTLMKVEMEQAIKKNKISWHALPFTTHTELADSSLFDLGIQISKKLDNRFNKKTIAAKFTDVPGHTRSLIPLLAKNGIKLLHIGTNSASTKPKVPTLFRWYAPNGDNIIVIYQQGYGGQLILPEIKTIIDIRLTMDNHGPHSVNQIRSIYKNLHKKYPNATIKAASLNEAAQEIAKIQYKLPVVYQEIGDTWIHGIGSDPILISQFMALTSLRRKWLKEKRFLFADKQDIAFGIPLLMIAEHTWGRDVDIFLKDWSAYDDKTFQSLRSKHKYKLMEQSWNEKRQYIKDAINSLPDKEKYEAVSTLESLKPDTVYKDYQEITKNLLKFENQYFYLQIDPITGSIIYLKDKQTHKVIANKKHPLFLISHHVFSSNEYQKYIKKYLIKEEEWAINDFSKPGLNKANIFPHTCHPKLSSAYIKKHNNELYILLKMELKHQDKYDTNQDSQLLHLELKLSDSSKDIQASLKWIGKQASRIPESMWISIKPKVNIDDEWHIYKMGRSINFRDIVSNGNRKAHICTEHIQLERNKNIKMKIYTYDAPLVMFGKSSILNFNNKLPKVQHGLHICLYNNIWGTNFPQWFEGDVLYRFKISL